MTHAKTEVPYNLRFPGQIYDSATGLNQNWNRDYDPVVDRYIESDLFGLSGGSYSTYAYAGADPLSTADPEGLCKVDLRFKPAGPAGKLGQYHAYVVTTDPDGTQWYYRGGPQGVPNLMSIYGYVTTEYGYYVPGTIDWDPGKPPSVRLLDNDASCECLHNQFTWVLNNIEVAHYYYGPLWKNSNSVVGTMLRDSGFVIPALPVSAPMFNTQLKYP